MTFEGCPTKTEGCRGGARFHKTKVMSTLMLCLRRKANSRCRRDGKKKRKEKKSYLPDTSPQSIVRHLCTPNLCHCRRIWPNSVSMHTGLAPASKCIHLFRAPQRNQCLVVLFFLHFCPDGICVNNIGLVRQKISTG